MQSNITVYHIPICPFSQRLEILLALKGIKDSVNFEVVDITKAVPDALLKKTDGSTEFPVLETTDGKIIKESLVILQYLEDVFDKHPIAQQDPYKRAIENWLVKFENDFIIQGYTYLLNQDINLRDAMRDDMLKQYARLNNFLVEHAQTGPFLFENFGWAETVFTSFFMRFWFLEYYEDFQLPDTKHYQRVREWIDACIEHPAAQQVTKEEIIKLYYDYSKGAGNGALLPNRKRSSFVFEPDWSTRPWPSKNKYQHSATDEELGL